MFGGCVAPNTLSLPAEVGYPPNALEAGLLVSPRIPPGDLLAHP